MRAEAETAPAGADTGNVEGALSAPPSSRVGRVVRHLEHGFLIVALVAAALLPLIDTLGRPFGIFVPAGADYLQQLVLWLAFLGGLVATREHRHLSLSTAELFGGAVRRFGRVLTAAVSAATVAILAYAAVGLVLANREDGRRLMGGVPVWLLELVMPAALTLMTLRFALGASTGWPGRAIALAAVPLAFSLGLVPDRMATSGWPMAIVILTALVLGTPVFVAMAALALFFFFRDGLPVTAVTAEVYRLISSPTLPAIPLLTACGYVLAESDASLRLLRFFKSLLGWMPGGLAVIVIAVCALFTTFTGGSGITVIAIGGLVLPMLMKDGYPEGFSLGLVTAAGSLGLLFPPSLPVILYSVVAGTRDQNVPADLLYLAGLLPGILMIVMVAAYAVRRGHTLGIARQSFSPAEVAKATWEAKWELSLPVFVVGLFMTGKTSMVETAALAFVYSIVVECFITRDLHVFRTLPTALVKSSVLAGAVLILLSAAMGITSYIVDAQIPDTLVTWVKTHIESRWVFLLALNGLLIVVGCLVDIFSAIVVLAPLLVPMAVAFDVHPIHLGVIFLANLELGYLTPPVGLNLYLAASRFNKPLTTVVRTVLPFLLIMAVAVLLITYVPRMSLGVLRAFGRL
ncbi:MAG TPA: TRAP transporter large permease subunit [Vicinamibacteria bacterium]|nr:TRAP transporter large permease subunit [Vicinamibacteria bacterium]